jgi:hypothetical protein
MGRHDDAYDIRVKAAKIARDRDHADSHQNNGEENKYKDADGNRNFIANYTKGFRHHPKTDRDAGEVINPDYRKLLDAIESEKSDDFEDLTLGLGRKLTNPQAGFAYDMEGPDSHDIKIRRAPKIDSAEAAGEMAELYWMALCRDVPFGTFDANSTIGEAVADLSTNYSDFPHSPFPGPAVPINSNTIFRGATEGDRIGPYISQFLYKPILWGSQKLEQVQRVLKSIDYLTDYDSWLKAQDGENIPVDDDLEPPETNVRHILTPRDLAYYVHVDALYQAYLGACLILLRDGNKPDPLLPYQGSSTQTGFGTFGGPHILSLVTEVATRALKAVWFQKWGVHRRLRPEAFGGLIHRQKNSESPSPTPDLTPPNPAYPINTEILNSAMLPKIFTKYNSNLLPQAFPEGSPTHPSYGAGHATVAGACVTILKAWFDENDTIKNPKRPTADGTSIEDASGLSLKVGDELNKVAANIAIGRNWAGVHYRSDYTESIVLGEKMALGILQEQATCYHKDDPFSCTLKRFDGKQIKFEGTKITEV